MEKKVLFVLFLFVFTFGFSQEKSIDKLSAAPNPFANFTEISFVSKNASTIIFSIKNVLGKTVFRKIIKTRRGKNSIPFYKEGLSAGMYIYAIQDTENVVAKRFVIR